MTAPTRPSPFGPQMMDEDPLGIGGVYDPQASTPDMIDPAITVMQETMRAMSPDIDQPAGPSEANAIVEPNEPEFLAHVPQDEQLRLLAVALYGSDFPAINEDWKLDDWASWARGRWDAHRSAVETHLHLVERNRLFRGNQQHLSSTRGGPWKQYARPSDSAKVTYNLIDKALDQRLQIMTDQRPGFHVEPSTTDVEDKKKAEARQQALEYQYDQQGMQQVMQVAAFWAQTDGISFLHTRWDPDRGPWDERMGEAPNQKKPLGDLATRVLRCEQVRVSANATKTDAPYYRVIKETIPASEAAYAYGVAGVQPNASTLNLNAGQSTDSGLNRWVLDQTTVGEGNRLRDQETVDRYTVYIEPHPDILPEGLELIVIGDAVIWGPGPLLFKMDPVAEIRDGSTDPSYYPRPIMEQWLDPQIRINALLSKWVDSVRVNAVGRFLGRAGAIVKETFVGGGTSVLEVNGAIGSLDDVLKPVPGFSVGSDLKDLLALEIKAFEDASGYNDMSRGQASGDASGRAILASREQLERVYAPGVQAMAQGMTKWSKINCAGMAFGYDIPRNLGTVGKGRPDLARALSARDFDGVGDARVEAETLMPVPRAYRQFRLDDLFTKGLITPQQYMRRQAHAVVNDLTSPDEDQEARAKRITHALMLGQPVPEMRWQDNEAIHQDVLEREIILRDDLEPGIIAAAQQRWADLANQAKGKALGMMPGMAPGGPAPPNPGDPPALNAGTQPLASSNPSIGAAPPQGGVSIPGLATAGQEATAQFEATAQQ